MGGYRHLKRSAAPHGYSRSGERLYGIWVGMRRRVLCESDKHFAEYGGRGISICREWDDYRAFRAWALRSGYAPTLTLDRENNDGPYDPDNCRWATAKQQGRNKRNNVIVTYRGRTAPLSEHVETAGVKYLTVYQRMFILGWPVERALETPTQRRAA